MKKLLIVTPRYPFPPHGGDKIRIYNVLKFLSAKYSIDLLCLEAPSSKDFKVENWFSGNIYIYNNSIVIKIVYMLYSLIKFEPLQSKYFYNRSAFKFVKDNSKKYDLMYLHLVRVGFLADAFVGPKVIDFTDAISLNYSRIKFIEIFKSFRKFLYFFEFFALKKYESKMIAKFDSAYFISAADKDFLSPYSDSAIIFGNGVNFPDFFVDYDINASNKLKIGFVGNTESLQNKDSILWFCHNVLDVLNAQSIKFVLKIVGKASEKFISSFSHRNDIEFTRSVDDISENLLDCFVGICPVLIGAGVQNKILEYMAVGLPTITTSIGHEGLSAAPGDQLIIANSPSEFIQNIIDLSQSLIKRRTVGLGGMEYVKRNHDWNKSLNPLYEDIKRLIEN